MTDQLKKNLNILYSGILLNKARFPERYKLNMRQMKSNFDFFSSDIYKFVQYWKTKKVLGWNKSTCTVNDLSFH